MGPDLPLTHEFLAMMLGARRPGVTDAMQVLERAGAVARKRGLVVITNRASWGDVERNVRQGRLPVVADAD